MSKGKLRGRTLKAGQPGLQAVLGSPTGKMQMGTWQSPGNPSDPAILKDANRGTLVNGNSYRGILDTCSVEDAVSMFKTLLGDTYQQINTAYVQDLAAPMESYIKVDATFHGEATNPLQLVCTRVADLHILNGEVYADSVIYNIQISNFDRTSSLFIPGLIACRCKLNKATNTFELVSIESSNNLIESLYVSGIHKVVQLSSDNKVELLDPTQLSKAWEEEAVYVQEALLPVGGDFYGFFDPETITPKGSDVEKEMAFCVYTQARNLLAERVKALADSPLKILIEQILVAYKLPEGFKQQQFLAQYSAWELILAARKLGVAITALDQAKNLETFLSSFFKRQWLSMLVGGLIGLGLIAGAVALSAATFGVAPLVVALGAAIVSTVATAAVSAMVVTAVGIAVSTVAGLAVIALGILAGAIKGWVTDPSDLSAYQQSYDDLHQSTKELLGIGELEAPSSEESSGAEVPAETVNSAEIERKLREAAEKEAAEKAKAKQHKDNLNPGLEEVLVDPYRDEDSSVEGSPRLIIKQERVSEALQNVSSVLDFGVYAAGNQGKGSDAEAQDITASSDHSFTAGAKIVDV